MFLWVKTIRFCCLMRLLGAFTNIDIARKTNSCSTKERCSNQDDIIRTMPVRMISSYINPV